MSLLSQLKVRMELAGIRGVIGSVLRLSADRIDRKTANRSSRTQEFMNWVHFAVPGMLADGNIDAMEYAVANMPVGYPVLEIGSFCGLSTVVLSYWLGKQSNSVPIFSCDKWEFEGQELGSPLGDSPSITHDTYRDYVRDTFLHVMQTFAPNRLPHTIECLSDEFFRRWSEGEKTVDVFGRTVTLGGRIGFCYIDGNHTYEFVRRDFENTHDALVPGGFIFFDDSADGSPFGVNRLAREVVSGRQYDLVLQNPNYLFRKR